MTGTSTISNFAASAALRPIATTTLASEARIFLASFRPFARSPWRSYSVSVPISASSALSPRTACSYAAMSEDLRMAISAAAAGENEARRQTRRTAWQTRNARRWARPARHVTTSGTNPALLAGQRRGRVPVFIVRPAFERRNVGGDAGDAVHLSRCVADRKCPVADPTDRPVRPNDAVLLGVGALRLHDRRLSDSSSIVGVDR